MRVRPWSHAVFVVRTFYPMFALSVLVDDCFTRAATKHDGVSTRVILQNARFVAVDWLQFLVRFDGPLVMLIEDSSTQLVP